MILRTETYRELEEDLAKIMVGKKVIKRKSILLLLLSHFSHVRLCVTP